MAEKHIVTREEIALFVKCGLMFIASILLCTLAPAAENDWAEGIGTGDGATKDFYNKIAHLNWVHPMGDWVDAHGAEQGSDAYATASVVDNNTARFVEWDVTRLVQEWLSGKAQNQGFFLCTVGRYGSVAFCSRQHEVVGQRPALVIQNDAGTSEVPADTDTFIASNTAYSNGTNPNIWVMGSLPERKTLIHFDLAALRDPIVKATLRLFTTAQGSSATIGVFRCKQGNVPEQIGIGLAGKYPNDAGISAHPNVIFATGFEEPNWKSAWTSVIAHPGNDPILQEDEYQFQPLLGKALRTVVKQGSHYGMDATYAFSLRGYPYLEEAYFRYYIRFGSDWNQSIDAGKLPGLCGTNGKAGWGGRKSNGINGWSARGVWDKTIPKENPIGDTTPIGNYSYFADMVGTYGDPWYWQVGYRGFLQNNRWYCLEQHVKMNTPGSVAGEHGVHDGIFQAWVDGRLAFEKTDIRWRDITALSVKALWLDVYHGGIAASPYDQHLYFDNVVVATEYIGPMNPQ